MKRDGDDSVPKDVPLHGTLFFVFALGIAITIGWFAMFMLLKDRW